MSSLRIAANELRRLSAGTLPKLALVALVLVPLLYASLYLYANYDPYGRLDKLPAAVVTDDAGATGPEGRPRNVGREVTDELVGSGTFQWHEVSAERAADGVRDNDYAFSITIPGDFSAALLSTGDLTPRQATITLTTNDANNYLAGTIADQVAEQVRATIAEKVGSEAADRFLIGFSTIYGRISEAADGAARLADGAADLRDGQQRLAEGAHQLAGGTTELATGLETLRRSTADLPEQSRRLADGASQVADGNARVAQAGALVADGSADLQRGLDDLNERLAQRLRDSGLDESQVRKVLSELGQLRQPVDDADAKIQQASGQLDTLADGARQVADGAQQLAGAAPALSDGIASAADGAGRLRDGAAELDQGEQAALAGSRELADGAATLRDGLAGGLAQIPHPDDPTRAATANTIADPVAINSVGLASAGTYGAGLAPFFIALATWIGAFVLFLLLRPLSTRALTAGAGPLRVALGGWLPAALLGVAQVLVLFAAVAWLVGIRIAHPVLAVGFVVLASLAFTAIVHALNALFGAVGKFLALVLLVLQLVSAGGTFPWQTIPDPLYPLHVVLPMSYVIDGLRHLLYSGASPRILGDVAVLLAYLVGALAVSALAARQRRVWTVNQLKPELAL
ncbi:putative membrane protein [Amycolatopsis arida]|uniref:Putative membrane protein n=1 Tax=Amycolatopsis arida TaxID=587909 RepID=A0A1I6AF05_9PSEU|nr:YhgE/Pip domain-containing protein [Amycolatopsis arida]TDX97687.1 putative membrane protein [Amycolatopsis arida]SFQ67314.1 putative membrane protein [Amycolatopsis arida]